MCSARLHVIKRFEKLFWSWLKSKERKLFAVCHRTCSPGSSTMNAQGKCMSPCDFFLQLNSVQLSIHAGM
jgi:hypothetical protein